MKKLNKKGFTLIELLAVITIMGILMLVAIPAVSRTIENSRRDTFVDTAKAYMNAVKNAVAADEMYDGATPISGAAQGYYYYGIKSADTTGTDLMEQGGKSSWGNQDVTGYVVVYKTVGANGRTTYEYAICLEDTNQRGITQLTKEKELVRSKVLTSSGVAVRNAPSGSDNDKFGSTKIKTSGTAASGEAVAKALTIVQ